MKKLLLTLTLALAALLPGLIQAATTSPAVGQGDAFYISSPGRTQVYAKSCIFLGFCPHSAVAVGRVAFYDQSNTITAGTIKGYTPYVPLDVSDTANLLNYPVQFLGTGGCYMANGLMVDSTTDTITGEVLYIPLQ